MTDHLIIRDPASRKILFTPKELRCSKTFDGKLADGFARDLSILRLAFGRPMRVNSCCRSAEHNRAIGGHQRSLHVYDDPFHDINGTAAIDIHAPDGDYMRVLIGAAINLGWSVGVAKRFVHLDRRDLAGLDPAAFGY